MKKAFKYRLCPNKTQIEKLQWVLDHTRELYNAALQERRDAYRIAHKSVTYGEQSAQLPEIKEIREEYKDIHSQVLQDVLRRVDKAFQAFFRRCKAGKNPGYPRFQGRDRYDSFCYPQKGFSLTHDNRVCLSKIGSIKVKLHRELEGEVKTCTIKREGELWYVCFICEIEQSVVYHSSESAVGVDLGVIHLATLSTGETIENPRYYRRAEKKLAKLHQSTDQKKRGSHRHHKAIKKLRRAYRKVRNQRADFLHKESRKLVNNYNLIVFEDLSIPNLVKRPKSKQDENGVYLHNGAASKSGINKSIQDTGWGQFVGYCKSKAEEAGSTVLTVNPKYTSQMCSGCGAIAKKELKERWYSCSCGCELDRDHNAAINILRAGRVQQLAMAVEALCP